MSTCLTSICLLYNTLPKSHCTEMNLFCTYNYVYPVQDTRTRMRTTPRWQDDSAQPVLTTTAQAKQLMIWQQPSWFFGKGLAYYVAAILDPGGVGWLISSTQSCIRG